MTRRRFACALIAAVVGMAAAAALQAEPLRPTADSWPTFRGDGGFTGTAPRPLPGALQLKWSLKTGGPLKSSPVIGGGTVFIGSTDGFVYCASLPDGRLIWKKDLGSPVEAPPLLDGTAVYVGTMDGTILRLYSATGAIRWKAETEGRIVGSANLLRQGDAGKALVLVGSYDGSMYAFDAATGARAWKNETKNFINGSAALIGNLALFGGCDALLHVVSVLDGRTVKEIPLGSYAPGSPAAVNGRVYVGDYDGRLVAVDIAKNEIVWSYESAEGGAFFSSPAVSGGAVVVGNRDGRVYCVDAASGAERWKWDAGAEVDSSPVIAGNVVIVGTGDGRIVELSVKDGKQLWSWDMGEPVTGSPAVASGFVVVGSDDGSLYAFGE